MIAFTTPVASSRTRVEPGRPRSSAGFCGTQTSLMVVPWRPLQDMRAGMNRAVWFGVEMEVLCGVEG
jgi:hypothetical protein